MNQLNYGILDINNDRDITVVADMHCRAPEEWMSGHLYTEKLVVRTVEKIRNSKEKCYVAIARNEENTIVGMHWIQLEVRDEEKFGNIFSLWVNPKYRQLGVATHLKGMAESWLRSKGASEIRSHVFLENKKMMVLNEKLGYKPVLLGMSKSIK
ncbi:GNAT family N-acetyltransferase [Gilvimarinus polysaccharolyticus]|uniref:GNAT family N-acetyltransferase n=1 Tax=Gilvimarinus polysaccharolyticus TaxID=863921 RepID=UPI000673645A|nr:GNAT family N-acetyltransferase [Gilvimarinus polysaccharolyticus]